MRPVAYGRPGTEVIPAGWQEAHRPAAEGTMTGTIVLRHDSSESTTDWDPVTEQTTAGNTGSGYYAGPCRIQALTAAPRDVDLAEETVAVAGYLVTVRSEAEVIVGDYGTVSQSGDPLLDGRRLKVESVIRGTLRFERDLICQLAD